MSDALVTPEEMARLPVEAVDLLTRIMKAVDAATVAPLGPERDARRKELWALLDEGQNHPVHGPFIVNTIQRLLDREQSIKFAR
jgi:hypothetical protein